MLPVQPNQCVFMRLPVDFEAIFDHAPNPYVLLTPDLEIAAANQAYLRVTASTREALIGRAMFEVFPNDREDPNNASKTQVMQSILKVFATGNADEVALVQYRAPVMTEEGPVDRDRFWSATHTPIFAEDGKTVTFVLQHTVDVTALHNLKQSLKHSAGALPQTTPENVYRLQHGLLDRAQAVQQANFEMGQELSEMRRLYAQAPGFTAILRGPEFRFELANDAYLELIGHCDVIGKTVTEVLPEVENQGFLQLLRQVFLSQEPFVGRDVHVMLHRPDAEAPVDVYLDFIYHPIVSEDGSTWGVFVQGQDVTEQKLAHDLVRRALDESEIERNRTLYLSQHDSMTGLPNRATFHSGLEEAVRNASSNHCSLAVFFLDVDRFKEVNDSYGHHVGDMLLKAIAQRLKEQLNPRDIVARLSGDEFGIIANNLDDVDQFAAELVRALAQPFSFDRQRIAITVSVGYSCYPDDSRSPTQLLMNADRAMYHAKHNGRSGYEPYTEALDKESLRRYAIRDAIDSAMAEDRMQLCYQPLVSLESNEICSVEALVRLSCDDIPLLTPAEIITVAEESGQIIKLGEWILQQACEQAGQWQAQTQRPFRVAVNVSAQQLREGHFLAQVDQALERTGLDPDNLEIEITERMLVENNQANFGTLKALRERGVHLAVDDFGTGFSSLGYLKHFPVDTLKIDQVFVSGLPENQHDAAITAAIVDMARGLGLKVVAEGIESRAQVEFLRNIGCTIGQGYWFSAALSAEALTEQLAQPS